MGQRSFRLELLLTSVPAVARSVGARPRIVDNDTLSVMSRNRKETEPLRWRQEKPGMSRARVQVPADFHVSRAVDNMSSRYRYVLAVPIGTGASARFDRQALSHFEKARQKCTCGT